MHYASGERGARNLLTRGDLDGLRNRTKCREHMLLVGTHLRVNFLTVTAFGFLSLLNRVRVIRKLHYRMGVREYNV